MNGRQRLVLGVGLGIVALLLLFPPWTARIRIPPVCDTRVSLGYGLVFLPPSATDVRLDASLQRAGCPVTATFDLVDAKVEIDLKRWLFPIALVVGLGATVFFALADATTRPEWMSAKSRTTGTGT